MRTNEYYPQCTNVKMAAFHFTSETPSESLLANIQTLNKFSGEQYEQMVGIRHRLFKEPSMSSKLLSKVDELSEEYEISATALRNVIKSLLTIPYSAVKRNMTPSQLEEDLVNLGLSEEKSTYLSNQWKANLVALSRTAVGQSLMINQLVDMEWKFGVTASSNEVNKVGNTFLQLKLVINKGNRTENVYMELTVPQFYSFLHEMEKAKSSLDYFSQG
ncbi:COMM domain-containing protein 7-like isoform X2 [Ptychodera flava]|uniref:COMM domain-containing protein 7-like isoform X2 n=1 Tax=Ptychodera flava TaxID=63121 RepID=UPI003969CE00